MGTSRSRWRSQWSPGRSFHGAVLCSCLSKAWMRASLWRLNSDSKVTRVQLKVTDQAPCCPASLSGPSPEIIATSRSPSSVHYAPPGPPPPAEPCLPSQDASFSKVLFFLGLFLLLSQSPNVLCRVFSSNLEPGAILASGKKKRKKFPCFKHLSLKREREWFLTKMINQTYWIKFLEEAMSFHKVL